MPCRPEKRPSGSRSVSPFSKSATERNLMLKKLTIACRKKPIIHDFGLSLSTFMEFFLVECDKNGIARLAVKE